MPDLVFKHAPSHLWNEAFYFGRKSGEWNCFYYSSDVSRIFRKEVKAQLTVSFALTTPEQLQCRHPFACL